MSQAIRVILKDGLGFPAGINPARYSCVIYLRVPDNWLQDGKLLPAKAEAILENMYGKTWRSGNDDGSYYAVLSFEVAPLSATEEEQRIWMERKEKNPDFRYWLYHVSDAGEFTKVDADNF